MTSNINPLQLNSLYYFNAHTRSDDDVKRTFIVRKEILQELIDGISNEDARSIPQHYMIIGSRGMGKSTLLRRLEIEMRAGKMKEHFIPILFPEEQYNIDRLSKFWLNSLDALADTFEEERNETETEALDQLIKALTAITDENELSDQAFDALKAVCARYKRRPVFLIDNIDILFDGISKDQQFKLRKNITQNGAPIFVGASTQNPDESLNYDAAFYDAFDNIYLSNLSNDEMREMLIQLAIQTEQENAIKEIYSKTAQLDALHSLTGGNPRVAVFMFQLIANGLSDKIFENLNVLLDLITPLYKSNFEQLSKQAQVIVDALALNWDPCDLDMLSKISKLENNQLSSQLDRLIKAGWVERGSRFSEEKKTVMVKNKNYSIRERFFNIWYIMRRASRRQRGDLKSLTCFLETFYTREHLAMEKLRILNLIKDNPDADKVTYGLALAHAHERDGDGNDMENEIYRALIEKEDGDKKKIAKYLNPEDISPELYNDYVIKKKDWVDYLNELESGEEFRKAESLIKAVIKKDGMNDYPWVRLGYIYKKMNKNKEAEEAYNTAIKINDKEPFTFFALATLLMIQNRLDESEMLFRKVISIDKNHSSTLINLGFLLTKQKQYNEAESLLNKAISIDKTVFISWFYLGIVLQESNRNNEAENAYKKALELNENEPFIWIKYAAILKVLGKFDEAEQAYKKAIELDPTESGYWAMLGGLQLFNLNKFNESEESHKRAIQLDPSDIAAWIGYATLLHDKLGKYNEAKNAYEILLKLLPDEFAIWGTYGMLLFNHLGEYKKAQNAFETAFKLNSTDYNSIHNLVFLLRDKLNDIYQAQQLFNQHITILEKIKDNYELHQAIFATYEKNWGVAKSHWLAAVLSIGDILPENTQEDWYRAIAVTQKLGYGKELLTLFNNEEIYSDFRPMYEALRALEIGDKKYLLNVAEEVSKPAGEIYEYMKRYQGQ